METSEPTHADDADVESKLELPTLGKITRTERWEADRPTIVRDFAYTADNPLFWRLGDLSEEQDCNDEDPDEDSAFHGYDDSEGSGFKGAPPWLQSTTQEGGLSEEDLANQAPDDELHGRAIALFDFSPEHENEFALQEGQIIYISSRHGLGWLVAVHMENGDCGLVPEEYVRLLDEESADFMDDETVSGLRSAADNQVSRTDHEQNTRLQKSPETNLDQEEWVDEAESVPEGLNKMAERPDRKDSPSADDPVMTDEERQKILDAAEREMALVDAKLRE